METRQSSSSRCCNERISTTYPQDEFQSQPLRPTAVFYHCAVFTTIKDGQSALRDKGTHPIDRVGYHSPSFRCNQRLSPISRSEVSETGFSTGNVWWEVHLFIIFFCEALTDLCVAASLTLRDACSKYHPASRIATTTTFFYYRIFCAPYCLWKLASYLPR